MGEICRQTPHPNGHPESFVVAMASEGLSQKPSDWREWADELITVADDTLDSNWSDLLVDVNLLDMPPNVSTCKMHNQEPHHPLPNEKGSLAITSPNASSS